MKISSLFSLSSAFGDESSSSFRELSLLIFLSKAFTLFLTLKHVLLSKKLDIVCHFVPCSLYRFISLLSSSVVHGALFIFGEMTAFLSFEREKAEIKNKNVKFHSFEESKTK